jgi:hypothetical protein
MADLDNQRAPVNDSVELVEGRDCGGCTMCCKLLQIAEIDKPRFEWCPHCDIGVGCQIYAQRPGACHTFHCSYLVSPDLGPEWKPSRSRIVLTYEEGPGRIGIHVDPDRPDAWRREPYYSRIRGWAEAAVRSDGQVIVWEGPSAIAVLPGREKKLGSVPAGHVIVYGQRSSAVGVEHDVIVVPPDDPRLKEGEST